MSQRLSVTENPHKNTRRLRRVEDATILDIADLRKWGWLTAGVYERDWYPHGAHDVRRGALRLVIDDAHAELRVSLAGHHVIKLESETPYFGGRRWWLVCPITGRHARKLYFFPDQKDFRSREALNPKFLYLIQRTSGLNRVFEQRNALALKLNSATPTASGKPRGMRWKTYLKHLAKHRRLEKQMTALILEKVLPD